ncbi:hypothetical protein CEE45_04385 [Candidatus Heimdallarchaeota archaeon B3_Heim]|nr:MAG: hypothetical protein CEE45_04385 [Candidatus Heimdallarchaeota archaeon B3_Heim]
MVYRETITSAITFYYLFNGMFREGEETLTFDFADSNLVEVEESLVKEFQGTARKFDVDLDNFDEENNYAEILVGFTVWHYEDDESEIAIIVNTIHDELEKVGFIEDDRYFVGDGPDNR